MNPLIRITAPSSKSLSHRALICAALATGDSLLEGVLDSQDLTRTAECLRLLGATIEPREDKLFVHGIGAASRPDASEPVSMNVGESGTTCRLMAAVVTAITGIYRIFGEGRMHDRPVSHLTDALTRQGVRVTFEEKDGYPPLVMSSPGLSGGEVTINLEQSSQYLSGLLLAAPLATGTTTIRLIGKSVASWPYVALTLDTMARFGVPVILERRILDDWQPCAHAEAADLPPTDIRLIVHPAPYRAGAMRVEGDWSNASYFLAAGAVGVAPVRISGLNPSSAQGDRFMLEILTRMGARIEWTDDVVTVFPSALHGVHVDMNACPDIVPTVAAMAAFATGETVISGAAHLTLKECDRIQGPVTELSKAGVNIEARPDGMVIRGNGGLLPRDVDMLTHGDHRMAMSFAILELGGIGVHLDNPSCVAKSFPGFWDVWGKVRLGNGLGEAHEA
ncbi:3-phosphoshikimate 1-carboxyvinyltransferase [Desulfomicrobium macestii]|uniref:3-phosphoshikimate 1-carboxyvinyltransferase n=1 Tax=Desulfomicrobium macestii TaxID=90731 RepID=A0ABR9H3G2_9BACT|nr:3-phosphoshikimate 1-carboxyvinyltransferase [Desulfomicrobium macestii]MBE1425083.1 3-phosphoshikimate 1-carboxyvinyltransferase [Desulfomicrobium macestii]